MNKGIIFLILVFLLVNPINAKTIEENLYEGKSIEVPGYNISLLVIGDRERSIVTCINNEINIINKGNRRELENLKIEPTRIYEDYAKLQITYTCEECICDESCSNELCFSTQPSEEETDNDSEETTQQITQQITQQKEIQQESNGTLTLSIILFLIVLILLIILLSKKKR